MVLIFIIFSVCTRKGGVLNKCLLKSAYCESGSIPSISHCAPFHLHQKSHRQTIITDRQEYWINSSRSYLSKWLDGELNLNLVSLCFVPVVVCLSALLLLAYFCTEILTCMVMSTLTIWMRPVPLSKRSEGAFQPCNSHEDTTIGTIFCLSACLVVIFWARVSLCRSG